MKLHLEEISEGQEEVLVRYRQMNATVQAICESSKKTPKIVRDRFWVVSMSW